MAKYQRTASLKPRTARASRVCQLIASLSSGRRRASRRAALRLRPEDPEERPAHAVLRGLHRLVRQTIDALSADHLADELDRRLALRRVARAEVGDVLVDDAAFFELCHRLVAGVGVRLLERPDERLAARLAHGAQRVARIAAH